MSTKAEQRLEVLDFCIRLSELASDIFHATNPDNEVNIARVKDVLAEIVENTWRLEDYLKKESETA